MSTIFKPELYSDFSNSTRMNENKQVGHSKQERINSYWTRLSKISWFAVCGKQINYLLKLIIDLRDNDKSRYFAITEFNNCFIIRTLSLSSMMNILALGSEAICHFHARAITRRRKARFSLRRSRILFAAKHLRWLDPVFLGVTILLWSFLVSPPLLLS